MIGLCQKLGRLSFILCLGVLSLLIVGCGGGGGGGSSSGSISVFLADAPDPDVSKVEVDISRVDANLNGEWVVLSETPQTYDLLQLAQVEAQIASSPAPAGHYNQVRLLVTACRVTDSDGVHDCNIPSGMQTGIKLNLNYDVNPGEITGILLDFNVHKSLNQLGNGNWQLQPVIPAVVKVMSGTVSGSASDGTNPLAGVEVKAIYKAGEAYPLETEVNVSVSADDGTFKLWALLPGTYQLQFSWTDPNDANVVKTALLDNVVVTANQPLDVGAVVLN